MKKIILTESQTQKLVTKIISERYPMDDKFQADVECDFLYHGVKFKGNDITDISRIQFPITFDIDVAYRSFGINGISIYDLQGPEEIEAEITYNTPGSDEYMEDLLTLRLDWNNMVNANVDERLGYFGIGQDIEIELTNDDQGNVIVGSINLNINGF